MSKELTQEQKQILEEANAILENLHLVGKGTIKLRVTRDGQEGEEWFTSRKLQETANEAMRAVYQDQDTDADLVLTVSQAILEEFAGETGNAGGGAGGGTQQGGGAGGTNTGGGTNAGGGGGGTNAGGGGDAMDTGGDDEEDEETFYKNILDEFLSKMGPPVGPIAPDSKAREAWYATPAGICIKHSQIVQNRINAHYRDERKKSDEAFKKAGMCKTKKTCSNGVCRLG